MTYYEINANTGARVCVFLSLLVLVEEEEWVLGTDREHDCKYLLCMRMDCVRMMMLMMMIVCLYFVRSGCRKFARASASLMNF